MTGLRSRMREIDGGSTPSAPRVPAVFENSEADLDLGVGQRFGGYGPFRQGRQVEGRRLQAPVLGLANLAHRLQGAAGEAAVLVRPHGAAGKLGVEGGESCLVVLVAGIGASRHGCKPLAHDCHDRVDAICGLGFGRRRGRAGGGRGRLVHLRGRQRVGRGGGAWIEAKALCRARLGLRPDRSSHAGHAERHEDGQHNRGKRSVDHCFPLARPC